MADRREWLRHGRHVLQIDDDGVFTGLMVSMSRRGYVLFQLASLLLRWRWTRRLGRVLYGRVGGNYAAFTMTGCPPDIPGLPSRTIVVWQRTEQPERLDQRSCVWN